MSIGDGDEPVIGDGDTVGVAREVVQHVGGAAEGRLGIDHPRLTMERSEQRAKGGLRASVADARKREPSLAKGVRRPATSLPRKTCCSTFTGRKKWGVRESTASRLTTVRPRARHSGGADDAGDVGPTCGGPSGRQCRAQAFRVGRDLQQGRHGRPKQEVVHHALVGERETGERLRHGEDKVDVADGQELLLSSGHPRVARRGQTLRAMAITATVVREGRLRTLVTAIAMPTERRCAALRDGPEDASMLPTVTQARCVSRKRSPCRRTMSATSKGGRVTACGAGACGALCRCRRPASRPAG